MRSDIAVVGEFGEPILLVELKNKTGTSKDWAAKFRRNLAAHGFLPKAPFFSDRDAGSLLSLEKPR
jgi:hypothetical protein